MARRRTPFRSARDARVEASVSPMLTALRGDLLVAPDEETVVAHLEMMRLEQQLFASDSRRAARTVRSTRAAWFEVAPRRRVVPRPRRSMCVVAAVCLAFAGCGLDAVGALPAPLQDLSNSIKQHLGIAGPTPDRPHTVKRTGGSLRPARRVADSTTGSPSGPGRGTAGTTSGSSAASSNPLPESPSVAAPRSQPGPAPTAGGNSTGARHHPRSPRPPKKLMHGGGGPPPGFPTDWQQRAVGAAATQLDVCAAADVLEPTDCPQTAAPDDPESSVDAVHWTSLRDVRIGAVAVVQPVGIGSTGTDGANTEVTVYTRFQMTASYTQAGAPSTHLAYSAGLTLATMIWNGSSFAQVSYATGPVAQLPVGVTVPAFSRPTAVTDDALRHAVAAGFHDCTAAAPLTGDASVPNCPQHAVADPGAANARWSLDNDPLQGALTGFDAGAAEFTVTGTYAMTLTYDAAVAGDPPVSVSVSGSYTAALFFDGTQLRLLRISD